MINSVSNLCESYFNGISDLSTYKTNTLSKNLMGALKVASYMTIAAPLFVGIIYGANSLAGRVIQLIDSALEETPPKSTEE